MQNPNEAPQELNREVKRYQTSIKRLFNSPDGHIVLAMWRESHVNESSLDAHPTIMAYHVGKKEFVQDIINHLKDDGVLDEIKIEE